VPPLNPRDSNRRALLTGAIFLVVGLVLWFMFRPETPPEPRRPLARDEPAVAPPPVSPPELAPLLTLPAPRPIAVEASKPASVPYDQTPGMPSHPITAEHEHIQQELQLVQAMNDAMDLGDGARLRALIREHGQQFPGDLNQLRDGYDIVADCLEHPGPASTAAGERYFENERGSTLRRFVHRYCLEPRD
jgi:hypothetical protein